LRIVRTPHRSHIWRPGAPYGEAVKLNRARAERPVSVGETGIRLEAHHAAWSNDAIGNGLIACHGAAKVR
jgi:hypothetical protein